LPSNRVFVLIAGLLSALLIIPYANLQGSGGRVHAQSCSSTPIPGGGIITFDSNRDGDSDIYVMYGNECNLVNLTNSSTNEGFPAWSSDGTQLTFASEGSLYKMNADGSNRVLLYESPDPATIFASYSAWSPDGTKIAFQIGMVDWGQEIFLMNSDGTGLIQLTSNQFQDNSSPQWLPDGSKIVFGGRHYSAWGIYLMNPDGSGQYAISDGQDACSAVSPDGTKVVFKSHGGGYPGNVEIYTMNIDGSNRTQLTFNDYDILDTYPSWSSDGTRIAFMSTRDGSPQLYVMNADGSNQTRITNGAVGDGIPIFKAVLANPVYLPIILELRSRW